jgi:methionyl aminopeptidase
VLDYLTPHVKARRHHAKSTAGADYMVNVQGTSRHAELPGGGYPPYPASPVHLHQPRGVPRHPNDKPLKKGDIVNIDVTVIKDGWHGDNSRMYMVGDASIAAKRLCASPTKPCGTAS